MQTTKKTAEALLDVLNGVKTPYRAAKDSGIQLTTMYKSRLYKMILAGRKNEVRQELTEILAKN